MKRKLIAIFLSATMIMGSGVIPAYATTENEVDTAIEAYRYATDTTYNYRKTTDLEAEVKDDKVVITWPVVNKSGEPIAANPLTSSSSIGDPLQGYTLVTGGMIIGATNWSVSSPTGKPNVDATGSIPIYRGVSDKKTDYPVVVTSEKNEPSDTDIENKKYDTIKYLSDEVVSVDFAPAYRVEYSKDGVNWKTDNDYLASGLVHSKKLLRPVLNEDGTFQMNEDGSYVTVKDSGNTGFLKDQFVESISATLDDETEYHIRVTAYAETSSGKIDTSTAYKVFETTVVTPKAATKYPAFPTVEGGGTYTQGGRNDSKNTGDVYVVTNLTDSITDPQPGSLRYGLERKDLTAANKENPRTIVFAVGGTINIDPAATKSQRRMNIPSNTTILGQTAPGAGITIAGASAKISGNTIMRYVRFRLGDGYDSDAASASGENIVVDHCSFEWGVDETFSMKELINSSIQYNIIANSLSMVNKNGVNNTDVEIESGESEAKHGMGTLANGYNTSFTHNLYANHGTRTPRFEGSFTLNGITYQNKLDYKNNVCYNWGHNSAYGGERGNGKVNFEGNYYKPGPNTVAKAYTRFFDCDSSGDLISSYFIKNNVMTSSDAVTKDNSLGFYELDSNAKVLSSPAEMEVPYEATSAEDAYTKVLDSVGASYFRDAVDRRIINQVKNGTGYFVNSDEEDGGYDSTVYTMTETDTDGDGIPDAYEDRFGFDKNDKSDAAKLCTDETKPYVGYTNAEIYANDLLGEWDGEYTKASDMQATITSIVDESGAEIANSSSANVTFEAGKTYTMNIKPTSKFNDVIDSASVYLNEKVIQTSKVSGNSLSVKFTPEEKGAYRIAARVYAGDTSVFTDSIPVTVVTADTIGKNLDGFTSTDIGYVRAAGSDSYDEATGTLVSQGAGRVGRLATGESFTDNEGFHFNYKKVSGDVVMTAKVNNLAKLDYYQHSGLMIAADLDADSEFYMGAVTYLKGEDYENYTDITGEGVKAKNIRPLYRSTKGGKAANTVSAVSGSGVMNVFGIPTKREDLEPNYGWIRLEKVNKRVTVAGSLDGENWTEIQSFTTTLPDECYIGFATDAAQDEIGLVRYNKTEFSNISLEKVSSNFVYGDADNNGAVEANDAALTLEKSNNIDHKLKIEDVVDYMQALDVDSDGILSANDASYILQKSLNSDFVFKVGK